MYVLLFILFLFIHCNEYECSSETERIYRNQCYLVINQPETFNNARLYCKNQCHPSADLVIIPDDDVNSFLYSFRTPSITNNWIGYKNETTTNIWNWVMTSNDTSSYYYNNTFTKWSLFEPSEDGQCAEMWDLNNGEWNDAHCLDVKKFICAYDVYSCFGIQMNETETVCSGHGSCIAPNQCSCSPLNCFYGEQCEIGPQCDAILWSNTSHVCSSGKGICTGCESCNCITPSFYGLYCAEYINSGGVYFKNENKIIIEYYYENYYNTSRTISCDTLIANNTNFIGENPTCAIDETSTIIIELGSNHFLKNVKSFVVTIIPSSIFPKDAGPTYDKYAFVSILTSNGEKDGSSVNGLTSEIVAVISIASGSFLLICMSSILFLCCFFFTSNIICCKSKKTILFDMNTNSMTHIIDEQLMKTDQIIFDDDNSDEEMVLKMGAKVRHISGLKFVNYNSMTIQKKIGQGGGAGKIFIASWEGIDVAFKCYNLYDMTGDQALLEEFEREVNLLGSLSHPNIVHYYGYTCKGSRIGFIIELLNNGEIVPYVKKSKNMMTLKERFRLIKELVSGVKYLHSKKVIHRDLKSGNVMISDNINVKIIDFGLAKITNRLKCKQTATIGTSYYIPPEITFGEMYNHKCDVFSFSILAYEILIKKECPYPDQMNFNFKIENKVANDENYRPNISELITFLKNEQEEQEISKDIPIDDYYNFVKIILPQCWKRNSDVRPSFKQLYEIMDNF